MEKAQDFIDEYDNIHETLQDLYDDTHNKQLKQEIFELISVLEEDYKEQREEAEQIVQEEAEKELEYMNWEFERSRVNGY